MRNCAKVVLSLLTLALVVRPALAEESPRFVEKKIIHAVFMDSTGESSDLTVPDGGRLSITNRELDLVYIVTARVIDKGLVELTVEESSPEGLTSLETLAFTVGDGIFISSMAQFAVSVSEIRLERMEIPILRKDDAAVKSLNKSSCCIDCGRWEVCCYPSSGNCCILICTNTGENCSAGCTIIDRDAE